MPRHISLLFPGQGSQSIGMLNDFDDSKINPIRKISNNLLSHSKPNQVYMNKVSLINSNTNDDDINKYFLAIIIFIISLFIITILLTLSNINFSTSFKLGILTIMNTVNSDMYNLQNFDFYNTGFFSKLTFIVFMIIGRIELLSIFLLLKKFILNK